MFIQITDPGGEDITTPFTQTTTTIIVVTTPTTTTQVLVPRMSDYWLALLLI